MTKFDNLTEEERAAEIDQFGRELHSKERAVIRARAGLEAAENAWIDELKAQLERSPLEGPVVSVSGRIWTVSEVRGRRLHFSSGHGADQDVRSCDPPSRVQMEGFMRDELMHTLAMRRMTAEEVLAIKGLLRAIPIPEGKTHPASASEVSWAHGVPLTIPVRVRGEDVPAR